MGRDPHSVPLKSIVLFPLMPDTLYCGLAGILTIKGEAPLQGEDIAEGLSHSFGRMKASGMGALLDQAISLQEYLGGWETLQDVEKYILYLKQDPYCEDLVFQTGTFERLSTLSKTMNAFVRDEGRLIEEHASSFATGDMEYINTCLTVAKDSIWALDQDILSNIEKTLYLSGSDGRSEISQGGFRRYKKINFLLNSLDRLEVRGRDSAGIHITFTFKDATTVDEVVKELKRNALYDAFLERLTPGDLLNDSINLFYDTLHVGTASLTLTYKKASITGELGENGKYLRDVIRSDKILQTFISVDLESEAYLTHTRWASVGAITEENCHPINNFTVKTIMDPSSPFPVPVKEYPYYGKGNWWIDVALNGDIDNYTALRVSLEADGVDIDKRITTDTKIIPLQIERYLYQGHNLQEAFRLALNDFAGSHAIAMQSNLEPEKLFLALKGGGQSLYVGLCDGHYMFASEVYGLVELTPYFIKMDGEHERVEGDPRTKGQIFILKRARKDMLDGINAFYYDGHPLEISQEHIRKAEITTRDIDRKEYPHFLLKEILEAPLSVQKTLRGKCRITYDQNGEPQVHFNLGDDIVPAKLRNALARDAIRKIFVIGQGTAAVAGAAIADALTQYLRGVQVRIEAKKASDFSGFFLEENLEDTLVIAVTQSGTTTDTNRAVMMAKSRGAHLMAIVNRRQSDITHITDGVFYTSDGRDIEMSVASTKAFYSQIVAGYILALYLAQVFGTISDYRIARELKQLERSPDLMNTVISTREKIRESAWVIVKKKKYWAVVGSGPNKVAADEIRIKLSELCYKTISSDIIEDKKHIDLSSEPLIIVCAAGNPRPVLEDIVKDTAIFKAHAAAVVVIAEEGETRFAPIADSVLFVPRAAFPVSVILNTLAGHIWGYFAACSINEEAEFQRDFRTRLSLKIGELDKKNYSLFEKITAPELHKIVEEFSSTFHARRNEGFLSSMSTDLASDITLLLKYATGKLPLEDFWGDFQSKRVSSSPFDMLDICLGRAIDELSRPIDAIRHQAKTVTVGTSRKEEIPHGILFDLLRELHFSLENLTSKVGGMLRRIQKAVSGIRGYTLYDIDNLGDEGRPVDTSTISIVKRGGITLQMKSRVEKGGTLKGTKKTIVSTGDVYAGVGKSDRAPIVIIPLRGEGLHTAHLLLAHVDFDEGLSANEKKEVLGDKLRDIVNLINEYNLPWDDNCLEGLPIEFLLGEGVDVIAADIIKSLEGDSRKGE